MIRPLPARLGRLFENLTLRPVALYGSAMLRIGYGLVYLVFLLREFPHREALWGPDAAWTPALEHQYAARQNWYGWIRSWSTLLATTSDTRFELSYALALAICVAMVLGWRTRLTSVAFMLVVTVFSARDPFLDDGGDNVLVLMSIYLVFIASGRRLCLDARRPSAESRTEWAEVRRRIVTLVHNAAVLVVGFQMCVIYGAAALWKAQGAAWQNGTALYYVLHTDWFEVWPGLSAEVAGHATTIALIAYLTVFVQIGFPFAVFSKKLKYALLVVLLGMHLSIAVLLGIPAFSAAMIIGDSVFLPDAFWLAAGRRARRAAERGRTLRFRPAGPAAEDGFDGTAPPAGEAEPAAAAVP